MWFAAEFAPGVRLDTALGGSRKYKANGIDDQTAPDPDAFPSLKNAILSDGIFDSSDETLFRVGVTSGQQKSKQVQRL